jgi:hypothetical protein
MTKRLGQAIHGIKEVLVLCPQTESIIVDVGRISSPHDMVLLGFIVLLDGITSMGDSPPRNHLELTQFDDGRGCPVKWAPLKRPR